MNSKFFTILGLSRKYQLAQMKSKDQRVKLMNEILGGVKVLKLYGWEPSFMKQVLDIRDTEISVLKKAAYLNAFFAFFWTSVPFMVALAAFACYVLVDPSNVLTAEKGWFIFLDPIFNFNYLIIYQPVENKLPHP